MCVCGQCATARAARRARWRARAVRASAGRAARSAAACCRAARTCAARPATRRPAGPASCCRSTCTPAPAGRPSQLNFYILSFFSTYNALIKPHTPNRLPCRANKTMARCSATKRCQQHTCTVKPAGVMCRRYFHSCLFVYQRVSLLHVLQTITLTYIKRTKRQ